MSRFKIGQKVVVIKSHEYGRFKNGDVFTVDGFARCPGCGEPCIYLLGFDGYCNSECLKCGCIEPRTRPHYRESRFAPLQNNVDAIEYKMKVSIPELITIKEYQNQ